MDSIEWERSGRSLAASEGSRETQVGGGHYTSTTLQPWDVMSAWQHPAQGPFEGFLWGNALKYLQRYRRKGKPVQDLEKAKHYIEQLLRELDNEHS